MATSSLTTALQTTLDLFDDPGAPQTTTEIAQQLDLGRRATYERLDRLVEQEYLETKKVGGSGRVWWRPLAETDSSPEETVSDQPHGTDSKAFNRLVEEVEGYAIFTLDTEGYIQSWNFGAERIKGYDAAEILNEHLSVFYTEDERADGIPEQNLASAAEQGSVEEEGWRVRKDGSRFWANTTITAIYDDDDDLDGYLKITRDMTERREHEQTLTEQAEQLEQQRDEFERELDRIFDRISDGFYALDTDLQFRYLNERAKEVLELEESAIGTTIVDAVPTTGPFENALREALDTTESITFEDYYDSVDKWFYNAIYPSENGLSVYFRDITERKRREHQLEHYQQTIETIWDGVVAVDDTDRFVMVNDAFCEITGYDRKELLGERVSLVIDETINEAAEALKEAALADEREFATLEFDLATANGQQIPVEARLGPYKLTDGSIGWTAVIRDMSERIERERELERALDLLEKTERIADVGGWEIDAQTMDVFWSDHLFELLGVTGDEEPSLDDALDLYIDEDRPIVENAVEEALDAGESFDVEARFKTPSGEIRWLRIQGIPETADGEVVMLRGAAQDITERKERERALRDAKAQLEAATDAANVGTWRWNIPEDEMVTDRWFAETFGVDPEAAREGVSLDTYVSAIHEDDRDRVEDRIERALASCGEYNEEYRVWNTDDELRWVVARGHVECDEDGNAVSFPGAIVDITDRKRAEMELERQREELAALNSLNGIVSEITETVIEKSTREGIEQVVCDALAATDSYEFAWLAGVDSQADTLEPRATAGTQGYAKEITVSLDSDDPDSQGPGATAIREQETQVIQDVFSDPDFEPWRDLATEYGVRALAAIPIVHRGIVYGILAVYADRPKAFDTAERAVISRLGEVVGHAIASVERKHALMSEEVVELAFQVRDVFEEIGGPTGPDGTITFDEVVPLGNGELLVYGTATADARESVERIIETLPRWESVRFHDEAGETTFELQMSEDTVLSTLASLGGELQDAVIENGDYQLTVQLPPSTSIRRLIEVVKESYSSVEVVKHRQIKRPEPQGDASNSIIADLTDRQRGALKAAFHSGFFEWPRDTTGEEIADSLGVTPPTFHQHLRKAEKKLVRTALPAGDA
jgi:PAS domain S-box-containing protein